MDLDVAVPPALEVVPALEIVGSSGGDAVVLFESGFAVLADLAGLAGRSLLWC
ncbi:hypothetical protein AB0D32_29365 [Micromonospora sp. NPDC048170]|uniref:hypothetical protein n=1 Tax=Micromonospora sp. NPDC048170 TaxID=3154819 RepID=UPI003401E5EB